MKLRDANLQVNEKNSFTYPPSCILPSFSKNTSRLLLPKSLWKCASTISIPLIQLSPCWICNWTFSWVQFLSNKLELIRFLQCKDYKNILLFALCFYMYLIVLHHGDDNFLFYFDICIKFTLSLIISTMKKWKHLTWWAYRKSWTQDSWLGTHIWDARPRTLHLRPGTGYIYMGPGTWDTSPGTRDLRSYMWDPIIQQPVHWFAGTGFYMIGTSIMKELINCMC